MGTFCCETIEGEEVYYGSTCVTRNTGIRNPKSAAARYEEERRALAVTEARQTPEFRALRARFALRDRSKIEIGRASADFIRAEREAYEAVLADIKAKYRISYVPA